MPVNECKHKILASLFKNTAKVFHNRPVTGSWYIEGDSGNML